MNIADALRVGKYFAAVRDEQRKARRSELRCGYRPCRIWGGAIADEYQVALKEETLAAMGTRRKTEDGKETNYGLGWRIGTLDGKNTAGHGGGQAGTST